MFVLCFCHEHIIWTVDWFPVGPVTLMSIPFLFPAAEEKKEEKKEESEESEDDMGFGLFD